MSIRKCAKGSINVLLNISHARKCLLLKRNQNIHRRKNIKKKFIFNFQLSKEIKCLKSAVRCYFFCFKCIRSMIKLLFSIFFSLLILWTAWSLFFLFFFNQSFHTFFTIRHDACKISIYIVYREFTS